MEENGRFIPKYDRDADAQAPAGGACASIRDIARWLRLHLADGSPDGAELIAPAALRETRQAQIEAVTAAESAGGRAEYYALGWNFSHDSRGRARNGHSGAFALGASTCVQLAPDQGLGIAALTNGSPAGLPEAVAATFMELALDGAVSRDWLSLFGDGIRKQMAALFRGPTDYRLAPSQPAPAQAAGRYAGRYASAYYGAVEVLEQGGALTLLLGPQRSAYPLRHWSGDQFVFQPAGENAVETTGVFFTVAGAGRAEPVRIEYLDQSGEGDFGRVE
ncbi:MAG: serine hydrolase [Noviherbaspirillum sp.]